MNHDSELDWLLHARPEPDAPSAEATARARGALIAHGERLHRRQRHRAGGIAAGGLLAAGAVAALATSSSGGPVAASRPHQSVAITPGGGGHAARAGARDGTPLVRLAADVRRLPAHRQAGDATLVVRYTLLGGHHTIGGAVYGGYDLYTDSGSYFYAPDSLGQLQQTVNAHQPVLDSGNEARDLRRIAAAAGMSPARARAAVLGDQGAAVRRGGRRHTAGPPQIVDVRAHDDSLVWIDATTALAVGAGRPAVRAACIKALDTLQGVRQTRTTVHGIRALRVTYPDGPLRETVWLDARTGVPIQERDGGDSTTTYAVERVSVARLPRRVPLRFILR